MGSLENLMIQSWQRKQRQVQKQKLILKFLRQHLWSSQAILQRVLGLNSRQAAHKTLKQIADLGFIKSHVFDALGGKITVWGITPSGQMMAVDLGLEEIITAYFEPSKLSEQNIRHQLDLQLLRIAAENHGWKNWIDGDRLGGFDKNSKRPDAIAEGLNGEKIAIECERTFKSFKRYEQILLAYLKLIKSGQIASVVWVSPTQDFKLRLEALVKSIKALKVAGQTIQIEPEKHHKHIYFCSYKDWPNYDER